MTSALIRKSHSSEAEQVFTDKHDRTAPKKKQKITHLIIHRPVKVWGIVINESMSRSNTAVEQLTI